MRQSMPSSSIESCAAVSETFPSLAWGQTNRPVSRRLENRQAPCVRPALGPMAGGSHPDQITLIKSPFLPRNTKRWPENGSSSNTSCANTESPLKPLRMSVMPAASHTLVFEGTGIKPQVPRPIAQSPARTWDLRSGCGAHRKGSDRCGSHKLLRPPR